MKNTKLYWLSILFAFLFFTACNKDDDPTPTPQVNESEVLAKFLESTASPLQKDYFNTDMPSIMAASEVKTLNETGQVYIIDIRSLDDFNNLGHIANAHQVDFANILTHVQGINMDDYTKVAIVCYTGQTASYAASLLRIMGYDKVFSMKWGMCSWNEDFAGSWNNAIANGNAYATQFTSDATEKGAKGDMPTLSTGETTGMKILESRMNSVIADGFAKITNATVFGNLSNYYILNYWPAAHYENPGHIPGAMQYTPKESIRTDLDLKTLPTDKTIVVYCYTGQTSAYLTAYLRLLGYDAQSLLFGTNGMIYDLMVDQGLTTFNADQIMGYDYEK